MSKNRDISILNVERWHIYRVIDLTIALSVLLAALPLLVLVWVSLLCSRINPIFTQERLGLRKKRFKIFKFRTMLPETPDAPTHMISKSSVTKLGRMLRSSKIDEIPQLVNVLRGDMSLVGPRPCLPSQTDLIKCRDELGIFHVKAGITGLAQVRRVDMSDPKKLSQLEAEMVQKMSIRLYFWILYRTLIVYS